MAVKQKSVPAKKAAAEQDQGFFLNVANWLLSRLPWFKDRYENWSKGKRIFIGLLMYLIVLPVIPIAIGIIMFVRDPEGFKKSKAFPILGLIIAAWLGAFGLIATQPPKVTDKTGATSSATSSIPTTSAPKNANSKDESDSKTATKSEAKKSVEAKTQSEPTKGRTFQNCDEAFKAGVFDIPRSDKAYADKLDGDNDGVACEK